MRDLNRRDIEVLSIKGSGWDMATIEPLGMPAVRLEPLRALLALEALSDRDMVNIQRQNLLDSEAPNPSVETLLHAFLPHKFIQHTHANAVLALSDQPNGESVCREVFGADVALVPYVMPGFNLSKKVKRVLDENPDVSGIILLKHGVLTFGETARVAYERMIDLVSKAESRIETARARSAPVRRAPASAETAQTRLAEPGRVAPILRGLLAEPIGPGEYRRTLVTFRTSDAILDYVNGANVERYAGVGPVTPDHAIFTKPWPVILPPPKADALDEFAFAARAAIGRFLLRYRDYFEQGNQRVGGDRVMLDPYPRVLLVRSLGLFAAGPSSTAADVIADLAEATIEVVSAAEAVGRYDSITPSDLFDIEYWPLEQAKLGRSTEKRLARHSVVITGGAGAIGAATATAFKAEGAEVTILDLPGDALSAAGSGLGVHAIPCDVTDQAAIRTAFDEVCKHFGGVDVLVSNAGAAWQGAIGSVDESVLRASFEVNFWAHQRVAQAAVEIMRRQGTGGVLLFNASKQAMNPGAKLGPYGLPKAATLHLARQYAVDHGAEGIRANVVNADRIRSGLLTSEMIRSRADARSVTEAEYMSGNLLGLEVTPSDVADAFVHLALSQKTTAAVLTVDGGNIAASVR
jgi:rhamnose utilization protein RhaD (predicted bifunctional aldolase and dehydrogenase)/NAD(P)-dependent dehydrogenase (short-subunit alcohol dehydrogenase family)